MDLGNTIQTMTMLLAPQHWGGGWSRENRVWWGAEDKDTPPPTSCVEPSQLDCFWSRAPPGGQGPMCPFSSERPKAQPLHS